MSQAVALRILLGGVACMLGCRGTGSTQAPQIMHPPGSVAVPPSAPTMQMPPQQFWAPEYSQPFTPEEDLPPASAVELKEQRGNQV